MPSFRDHVAPGPAGLMFDPAHLNAFGQRREREARALLERWCIGCGQPACHGYGSYAHTDGVWSCNLLDCRAQAEAMATKGAA